MPGSRFSIRHNATLRTAALKEAIVASFSLNPDPARMRLAGFEESDWLSVLGWLDVSGMAIYFYRRTSEIGADRILPRDVEAGLAQRLSKNRVRAKALLDEARVLGAWFETGNIPYAHLKGVTLTPHSVQESALRSQSDLDFMVSERFADLAVHYVHRLGYSLQVKTGNTLQFRAGAPSPPGLANIYSEKRQRALDLIFAKENSGESQLLSRRVMREFEGARISALSPADILVEQARHLLQHLCSESTRLSWVFEFWRHVQSGRGDGDFWRRAESTADEVTYGNLAMGVAAWVAEDFFGGMQAVIPAQWRSDALPVRVRLWLERYVRRMLMSDNPSNKLYALLQKEVPGGPYEARTICQILMPRVLPAPILDAHPHESRSQKWTRYRVEARSIVERLWFHFREGVRFAIEASRWSRAVARISR